MSVQPSQSAPDSKPTIALNSIQLYAIIMSSILEGVVMVQIDELDIAGQCLCAQAIAERWTNELFPSPCP